MIRGDARKMITTRALPRSARNAISLSLMRCCSDKLRSKESSAWGDGKKVSILQLTTLSQPEAHGWDSRHRSPLEVLWGLCSVGSPWLAWIPCSNKNECESSLSSSEE
jgi:hypothetical protein